MTLWTALFLGLAGSLHCAGMCGPLALALSPAGPSSAGFAAGRLAYNLGRVLTYALLGIVFGLVGHSLALAGIQRWVSIGLGLVLLAGLFSSRRLVQWRPMTARVQFLKSRMSAVLGRRSFASLAMLGFLNGFLPCGLVYVACAGATATGGVISGVLFMITFGLGTVPMMLAISLSGRLLPMSLRLHLRKAIPVSVIVLASLLILRGMSLSIPYLSPNLSSSNPSCCQK